ncbi:MAG TPA: hypothetical protein VGB37_15790 [Candidatus Lokiarchaeia archaeon]
MESHYKNALEQIIRFLENLEKSKGIKYYLVGGILVNLYSDFRITRDIDIALDLSSSDIDIKSYINLVERNNFFPYQDWHTTKLLAEETKIIQFLDKSETIRYDNHLIIIQSENKFKKIGPLALQRRIREKIFGIKCWVESKEDFIISKLIFGGWQDYADVLGCWMRFKEELDVSYLEKSCKDLKVYKELLLLKSGIDDPDEYFEKLNNY